jgi:hypothetical protein
MTGLLRSTSHNFKNTAYLAIIKNILLLEIGLCRNMNSFYIIYINKKLKNKTIS